MANNPANVEEAKALVRTVQNLFMPWNVEGIVSGFTSDAIVRFGDLPEMRGTEVLEKFFRARSLKQMDYKLAKTFHAMTDDKICNSWTGTWQDRDTGAQMQGRGVEVWVMREGKIAVWEAAFNASVVGEGSSIEIL